MRRMPTVFLFGLFLPGLLVAQAQNPGAYDRACLETIADPYIAAMVAHDISRAPFAPNVKFTENTIKLPLTEGLWFTASSVGWSAWCSNEQSKVGCLATNNGNRIGFICLRR